MRTTPRLFKILASCILILSLPLQATDFNNSELKEKVKARWSYLSKYNFDKTYDFETPAYKKAFTKQLYANRFSLTTTWNLTKISNIKYDDTLKIASLTVSVLTKSRQKETSDQLQNEATIQMQEYWLLSNGKWSHISTN